MSNENPSESNSSDKQTPGVGPSVLRSLDKTFDSIPRVSLKSSPEEAPSPILRPNSEAMQSTVVSDKSRYRLDGEMARGGMGAILRGRDTDLGRDLAVKVLLDEHRDKPAVVQRFIEEAQIGGQLQHPGIVPVYELGRFGNRRPFFTMKLVKGKTLAALIAERTTPEQERAKFLGIFEQVCQTMAYAHSRGVIHRDLKPANIMVGAFGEVQVMDWGLGKVLTDGRADTPAKPDQPAENTSIIQTIRSLGSDLPQSFGSAGSETQMGSVLGTPAYMPPEQALGEIDRLDERSDVFGLGAILCEILTGKPPYVGKNSTDVFRMASRGKLDDCFGRLSQCGVDEDLTAIVKDALAMEPDDRPANAGVLADRVSGYLEAVDARMRVAELERVEANTRVAEERKRRRVMLALAASVLIMICVAGGGWMWAQQKEEAIRRSNLVQRQKLQQQIASELATANALARLDAESAELPDRGSVERAVAAVNRAAELLKSGDVDDLLRNEVESKRERLTALDHDHNLVAGLENAWQEEMEFHAEQRRKLETQRTSRDANNSAGAGAAIDTSNTAVELELSDLDPIAAYEDAFRGWGLTLDMPAVAASKRLQALHPALQPMVFTSLDRWRDLLERPPTIEQWQQRDWEQLKPVELKSRGRDKLEVLEDGSILASGPDVRVGYDLVFDTDVTQLTALRLEALLHPSLPNYGPGRGSGGNCRRDGPIEYAPLDDLSNRQEFVVTRAVSDYAWWRAPITRDWNLKGGGGRPHVAVFECAPSELSDAGFRIWIRGLENPNKQRSPFRPGRFRWSASDVRTSSNNRGMIQRLSHLVEAADTDEWRQAMRRDLSAGDLAAACKRIQQGNIDSRSNPELTYMANKLANMTGQEMLEASEGVRWHPIQVTTLQSAGGTQLEQLPDQSILASGPNPLTETIRIEATTDQKTLSAIRLELVLHDDGVRPKPSFSRLSNSYLREFEIEIGDPTQRAVIPLALSERHRTDLLSDSIDANEGTYMAIWGGRKAKEIVFPVIPRKLNPGVTLRITLKTGGIYANNIQRFRISMASDEFVATNIVQSPQILLRLAVKKDPADYWSRLALAAELQKLHPPRLDEAMRHATAAEALRPDDDGGRIAILRSIDKRQLLDRKELLHLAKVTIAHLLKADDDHPAVKSFADDLLDEANRLAEQENLAEASKIYSLTLDLRPDDVRQLMLVAYRFGTVIYDYEAAIDLYRRAMKLNPTVPKIRSNLGFYYKKLGDETRAAQMYREEIGLFPDASSYPYAGLASCLMDQDKLAESIEVQKEAEVRFPTNASLLNNLAWALLTVKNSELWDPERALQLAEKAMSLDPNSSGLLNTLGVAHYRNGNWTEAIEMLTQSLDSNAQLSYDAFFLAMAHWQLGEQDKARDYFDQAVRWMDENQPENAELVRFRAESERLISAAEESPAPPAQTGGGI